MEVISLKEIWGVLIAVAIIVWLFKREIGLSKIKSVYAANLRFFSASAIGHEAFEGDPYDPWGVLEPVEWIVVQSGVQL